jgi:hypothetical protein
MSVAPNDLAAWLAVVSAVGVGVLALAMLRARSLFVTAAAVAAMSALAVCAVLLLHGGDGAVALAAFGVGIAPVLLMGVVLLSTRAAKGARGGAVVYGAALFAAVAAAAVIAPEWRGSAISTPSSTPVPLWTGALVLVAAAACLAVLGYGERGVLERRDRGPDA